MKPEWPIFAHPSVGNLYNFFSANLGTTGCARDISSGTLEVVLMLPFVLYGWSCYEIGVSEEIKTKQ